MRKQWTRTILGLLLVAAGLGFAGDVLDLWHFDLFFRGWWTLFIIVPCLLSILDHGFEVGNTVGLAFGILLFLSAQNLIEWWRMLRLLFPLLLVILGLSILLRPHRSREEAEAVRQAETAYLPELSAIFRTENRRIANPITGGASLTAAFGTLIIDLRDATIQQDIVVRTTAVFGSIHLLLPSDVILKADHLSLFGSFRDQMPPAEEGGRPVIYLSGTSVFGSTEVRG